MIYSDLRIRNWATRGGITPFTEEHLNPASIDLSLAERLIVITPSSIIDSSNHGQAKTKLTGEERIQLAYGQKYILQPGVFVLASSAERIRMPYDAAGMIMLKSTPARRGIGHVYAGFFDPGFEGNATFEIFSHVPVVLEPGMRICQLILIQMTEIPSKQYEEVGRYQGQTGPTPAREERMGVVGPVYLPPEEGAEEEYEKAVLGTNGQTAMVRLALGL